MGRKTETTVTKTVRSYDKRGEIEVTIDVAHSDSGQASHMAGQLHHAIMGVLNDADE